MAEFALAAPLGRGMSQAAAPLPAPNRNFFKGLARLGRILWTHVRKRPWQANYVTLLLAATVAALYFLPGAKAALQYDREQIAMGQLWRLWTSPLVHSSADHLTWNLLTLSASGIVYERLDRRRFVWFLLAAPLLLSAYSWIFEPQQTRALGYSGVAAGVLTLILIDIAWRDWRVDWWFSGVSLALLLLFVAYEAGWLVGERTPYEWLTGQSLRAQPGPVVISAHLQGIVLGALFALPLRGGSSS